MLCYWSNLELKCCSRWISLSLKVKKKKNNNLNKEPQGNSKIPAFFTFLSLRPTVICPLSPVNFTVSTNPTNQLPLSQLPCVCSRNWSTEWFNLASYIPYSSPLQMEKTLSSWKKHQIEALPLGSVLMWDCAADRKYWSTESDLLMDKPYFPSSYLTYMICAFIVQPHCLFLYLWRFPLPWVM